MQRLRDFDVIFCRNPLTYFYELSSRRAAENLYGRLHVRGVRSRGRSESGDADRDDQHRGWRCRHDSRRRQAVAAGRQAAAGGRADCRGHDRADGQYRESSEAAGQLETSMQAMAAGAEKSSSACQQSLSVVEAINQRIAVQKTESRRMQNLAEELRSLVDETTTGIDGLSHHSGIAASAAERRAHGRIVTRCFAVLRANSGAWQKQG
jgi:CheR methyltransferase, SAM binding domain